MNKYGYERYKYQDGFLSRLLLFLAMLLPSRIERDVFKRYLSPTYFMEFLDACRNEAKGLIPLKDYSFNAYYRHKWTQKDLKLHRPRRYVEHLKQELNRTHGIYSGRLMWAQAIYIAVILCRYAIAILAYPVIIFNRWRVTGAAYVRMVCNRNALPDTLP